MPRVGQLLVFGLLVYIGKNVFLKVEEKKQSVCGARETYIQQSLSHLDLTRRQLVTIVARSFGEKFFCCRLSLSSERVSERVSSERSLSLLRQRKTCLALTTLDITFWEVKIRHLMHQNASRSLLHVIPRYSPSYRSLAPPFNVLPLLYVYVCVNTYISRKQPMAILYIGIYKLQVLEQKTSATQCHFLIMAIIFIIFFSIFN